MCIEMCKGFIIFSLEQCVWEQGRDPEVLCRLKCSSLELSERGKKSNSSSGRLVGMVFLEKWQLSWAHPEQIQCSSHSCHVSAACHQLQYSAGVKEHFFLQWKIPLLQKCVLYPGCILHLLKLPAALSIVRYFWVYFTLGEMEPFRSYWVNLERNRQC